MVSNSVSRFLYTSPACHCLKYLCFRGTVGFYSGHASLHATEMLSMLQLNELSVTGGNRAKQEKAISELHNVEAICCKKTVNTAVVDPQM